jgi:ABC-type glutathione transport system ATPase component
VSVQAAIVELLRDLAASMDMALLFVTHDLGVVSSLCSRIYLLDQGVVAESGLVSHVLTEPRSQVGRDIVLTHQSNTLPSAGLSDRPVLDAI